MDDLLNQVTETFRRADRSAVWIKCGGEAVDSDLHGALLRRFGLHSADRKYNLTSNYMMLRYISSKDNQAGSTEAGASD
jgi:hypothetical protein